MEIGVKCEPTRNAYLQESARIAEFTSKRKHILQQT